MTAIHYVFLIPCDPDPHKLLGDPESVAWKCGARPPVFWCQHCSAHGAGPWSMSKLACHECVRMTASPGPLRPSLSFTQRDEGVLALAVGDEPLIQGCFPVVRALTVGEHMHADDGFWPHPHEPDWDMECVHRLVSEAARYGLGTPVFLDADRRELQP